MSQDFIRLRAVSLFSSVSHAREGSSRGEVMRVTRVCILAGFVRRTKKKERLLEV